MNVFQLNKRVITVWGVLLMLILVFSILSPIFMTPTNILSLLQNNMEIAIMAIGMTIVMIVGGIDMSIGASLGVLSIIAGWMIQANVLPMIIILSVCSIGILLGIINGSLIAFGKIPDIIVTIGTMYILRAMIFLMLGGKWLTGIPDILGSISKGEFLGVPLLLWVLILLYGVFIFLLKYTQIGHQIYAVGSNESAAKIIGINVKRVKILVYGFMGGLIGFAALLYLGRLGSVEITIGLESHILVIAAVVIGGTSVLGGSGSILGTLAGVFIMAVLRNGINLLGIPSLWERVFIGLFLLLSVTVDLIIRSKKNI